MSRLRLNVTFNIDWPGADTERSSLMPSTRLTASSSDVRDLAFDFFDRAARQRRAHHHVRQVDGREAIDAEPHERGGADHDERHDHHGREDRARMQMAARAAHDVTPRW